MHMGTNMKKTIDLISHKNITFTLFPDGQPHIDLIGINPGDEVRVICRLRYATDVLHLLEVSEVLDRIHAIKTYLDIGYLMAARYDRPMATADSFDLIVVARLINSCGFRKVGLFDPHSEVSASLIQNSAVTGNKMLVDAYKIPESVLIVPDKGASRKTVNYFTWNPNLVGAVFCDKVRMDRKLTLRVNAPDVCKNRSCVIIDDICDGGATFLAIADQIKPSRLTLIVTHGVFSKGLDTLLDKFDDIITTDSYQYQNPRKGLTVLRIYESNAVN